MCSATLIDGENDDSSHIAIVVDQPWIDEITVLKTRLHGHLSFLGEAAGTAQAIEHMNRWEYELLEFDDSLNGYLAEVYFRSVLDEITRRQAWDDEVEGEIEEDERHLHFARLGYTFTFDRHSF